MATRGIDFERFETLLEQLVSEGVVGQPPETNDDGDATLRYTWALLSVLHLDQDYSSYEKFETKRRQYHKAADSVARSIWLLLTPAQRSVFSALVTLSHALTRKRGREDDDDGSAVVKYRAGPDRERRQALETVQFMMDEMLPEIRREIAKKMALRPMMRFLRASKASMKLVEDIFPFFVQRDIVANMDYERGLTRFREVGREFMATFAPDGRRFWYERGLSANEREWLVARFRQNALVPIPETQEFPRSIFFDLAFIGVPRDIAPMRLYRLVMEEVASNMWIFYHAAELNSRYSNVGRRGCVWVAFSTPTHGHLFDVRFSPSQETAFDDPVDYTIRELRVLTGDPEVEHLFAPLREFYLARDRVFPKLVPERRDPDDSDSDEERRLRIDHVEVSAEKTAFQESMLNLLYGLSPLLTMTLEVQKEAAPVETSYVALDTNGKKYTPDEYAKRSTAVAAAASLDTNKRMLTLQGIFGL
jgi:hypothetical protein